MSQYLLSIYHGHGAPYASDEEIADVVHDVGEFNQRLQDDGVWVFANGLQPASEATKVVDGMTGPTPLVTDGPYLETKEHLGGFWIIDVADLQTALDYAEHGSRACRRKVEVRAFEPAVDRAPR